MVFEFSQLLVTLIASFIWLKYNFPIKEPRLLREMPDFNTGEVSLDQHIIPEGWGAVRLLVSSKEKVSGATVKRPPLTKDWTTWKPKRKITTRWKYSKLCLNPWIHNGSHKIVIGGHQRILGTQPIILKIDYYRKKITHSSHFSYNLYLIVTMLMRGSHF